MLYIVQSSHHGTCNCDRARASHAQSAQDESPWTFCTSDKLTLCELWSTCRKVRWRWLHRTYSTCIAHASWDDADGSRWAGRAHPNSDTLRHFGGPNRTSTCSGSRRSAWWAAEGAPDTVYGGMITLSLHVNLLCAVEAHEKAVVTDLCMYWLH